MKQSTNSGPESTLTVLIRILQRFTEFALIMRVRRNGQRFHVRTILTAHFEAAGQHPRYLVISEEVTLENPSAQSEEKFRRLLESTPDAMPIVNEDGRIPVINSRTEWLFGYRREDLIGQRIKVLVPVRFGTGNPTHRMDAPQSLDSMRWVRA
jgi:PAS domain-containing protein